MQMIFKRITHGIAYLKESLSEFDNGFQSCLLASWIFDSIWPLKNKLYTDETFVVSHFITEKINIFAS